MKISICAATAENFSYCRTHLEIEGDILKLRKNNGYVHTNIIKRHTRRENLSNNKSKIIFTVLKTIVKIYLTSNYHKYTFLLLGQLERTWRPA